MKLIRADINPPENFALSYDLPLFSQGNEPPLNLTEKVNRVVMNRMRAAEKSRRKTHATYPRPANPSEKNERESPSLLRDPMKSIHGPKLRDPTRNISTKASEPKDIAENISSPPLIQIDSLAAESSAASTQVSDDSAPKSPLLHETISNGTARGKRTNSTTTCFYLAAPDKKGQTSKKAELHSWTFEIEVMENSI